MYTNYAKHIGADEYLLKWVSTVLKNEIAKESKTTEEVEHILDYMVQCNKKVERMSYAQARKLTEAWDKTQQKKGNNIEELLSDTEVVLDFKDGFKIVKLIGENAYKREGFLMRHCVAGYYGRNVEIYSLRDKENMPHATMEKDQQIKGRGNGDISPKYIDYVIKFLEHIGMTVGDSEMKHLGYMNVEKIQKDLHKDTKFFNKKYLSSEAKLIDIDVDDYMSLDLLDIKPLIEEDSENNLKLKFDIPMLCKLSFEWLSKKKSIFSKEKIILDSSYSSQVATSGDYSKVATSGDSSKVATSGIYSKVATSGDYSQVATSGEASVGANIGIRGQIKGKIETWITLAEYELKNNRYECKLVRSEKIDGKIIKEDTWYRLDNGEFTEVK